MKRLQLKTISIGIIVGLLFVVFALSLSTQPELALSTLLFVLIIIGWFVRSILKHRT